MRSCVLALLALFPPLIAAGGEVSATRPAALAGFDMSKAHVPHGKVNEIRYTSNATGTLRPAEVYTPPGYSPRERFPVLYLLHGAGTDQKGWPGPGRVNVIVDNLIAEGRCVPMVVV